jgi:nucleoside-diphosphate-sugar epimerase
MKIAVTGSSGRLGRAVVAAGRARGDEVVGIDRAIDPDCGRGPVDLRDFDEIVEAIDGCDVLIHLAAITGPGWHPDHIVHDNNVTASYHALRAAAEVGITRVCQASSVNAIGGRFSRQARYDSFPVDETHTSYAEDPYSLSKEICEVQADAISRRFGTSIASLRLHGLVDDRAAAARWTTSIPADALAAQLWGYTRLDAAVAACLSSIAVDLGGHEVFYVVAPDTMVDTPSPELAAEWYPDVPMRRRLDDAEGFFDCSKAGRLLDWHHPANAPRTEEETP